MFVEAGEPYLILWGQKVNRLYFTPAFQQHFTETKEVIQLQRNTFVSFWGTYSLCNIVFGTIRYVQNLHLMDMPHIRVLHPDFSQSVTDVGFEERFIAETSGTVSDLYLLVVFTLCDRRDNNEKTEMWFKPGLFNL